MLGEETSIQRGQTRKRSSREVFVQKDNIIDVKSVLLIQKLNEPIYQISQNFDKNMYS